jgi:hypothetical protein
MRAFQRALSLIVSYPWFRVAAMGRPKLHDEPRVATAVRLPESVHRRLHDAARRRDVSVNLLVTRAVTDYLDRLPSPDVVLSLIDGDEPRRAPGARGERP